MNIKALQILVIAAGVLMLVMGALTHTLDRSMVISVAIGTVAALCLPWLMRVSPMARLPEGQTLTRIHG